MTIRTFFNTDFDNFNIFKHGYMTHIWTVKNIVIQIMTIIEYLSRSRQL